MSKSVLSKFSCMQEGARAAGCGKCGKAADKRCGSCHQVSYCCPEHQKADWKEHRKVCCPFMVKYSDELGRYLVASRDLKERTLVIKEAPFTFAPYDQADEDEIGVDQAPMCLGCCCRMSDMPDARCSTCHWPVCSKACEEVNKFTFPNTHASLNPLILLPIMYLSSCPADSVKDSSSHDGRKMRRNNSSIN